MQVCRSSEGHRDEEARLGDTLVSTEARAVGGFDPDLVVSSRPNAVDPGRRTAWYVLSPEPGEPSEVCVGGGVGRW
jgi:hypothetical protein